LLADQPAGPPPRRSAAVPALLAIIIVLLAGLAILAAISSSSASDEADRINAEAAGQRVRARDVSAVGGNRAVIDPALNSEVTGWLRPVLERAFSYDYHDLDRNEKAVADNLAGKARCQYDVLYGQVRKLAPDQQLTLTTRVVQVGVSALDRDRATVLVFIDQKTTRADQNQTTASGAQLGVEVQRLGGTWKVTNLDLLGQPLPNGQAEPKC
jgi:hypothetical protein